MTPHSLILSAHPSARGMLAEVMFKHWAQRLRRDRHGFHPNSTLNGRASQQRLQALVDASVDVETVRGAW